jgi:signal transduction histidine kinase
MFHRLYKTFIEPHQTDEDLRNRELVLNVLLVGTLGVLSSAVLVLLISYGPLHNPYVLPRLVMLAAALVATWWIYFLSRSGHYKPSAWLLICMYVILASGVAYRWGVTMPYAVALFGLVIMLAGTVLGAPYPLYMAGVCIIIIFGLKIGEQHGLIQPDMSWVQTSLDIGVVAGFCLVFGIIALVSWLFNEQTERSLHRAHRAEAGLKRQKLLLESKVEERTRALQVAQLEKIQQLYRFAELGQLSTALMHELANHLTALTLDIEGLKAENHSHVLKRATRSIKYIDDMVLRVRDQLHGKAHIRSFNVASEITEVMTILNHRASDAGVVLRLENHSDKKELRSRGELIRFRQLMANMIANGIDAYEGTSTKNNREVVATVEAVGSTIIITITDWGRGIDPLQRDQLFEPFFSTKKTGMGMGLFIARQIAEEHFHGTITLDDAPGHTSFIITLAKDT